MRREVVWGAAFFALGIGIRYLGGGEAVLAWAVLAALFWGIGCRLTRKQGDLRKAGVLLLIFFTGAAWLVWWDCRDSSQLALVGREVHATGVITRYEDRGTAVRIVLSDGIIQAGDHIVKLKREQKLMVTVKGETFFSENPLGCQISLSGGASLPERARNPGTFDYLLYLKTQGISLLVEAESSSVEAGLLKQRWRHWLNARKLVFTQSAEAHLGDVNAGLISAMLFGDKSTLDEDVKQGFQLNGGAHILAVSGIHAQIMHSVIGKLMRGRKGAGPSALTAAALCIYAALADFSPSVVRAVLMIAMVITAKLLHRRYDMLTACSLAFLLQLLVNPYTLFHSGFQMSYLAVAVISVVLPWARYRLEGLLLFVPKGCRKERLLSGMLPLAVIQGALMPAGACVFNFVSLTSFLFNPPVLLLGAMALPVGLLLLVLWNALGPGFSFLSRFLSAFLTVILSAMTQLSSFLSGFSWAVFQTASLPAGVLLLFYGGLFLLTCESWHMLKRKGRKKLQAGAAAALVAVACLLPWTLGLADMPHLFSRATYAMVFVDVGQGDCLHIRTPSGKNILIDGGGSAFKNVGEKTLLPYLLKNGVSSLDVAVITHMHTDHFKGISELAERMEVRQLVLYEGYREEAQHREIRAGEVLYTKAKDRIQLDDDVWIEVLYPERKTPEEYAAMSEADENFMSLVMRVGYKGITTLVTADVGFPAEEELLRMKGRPEEEVGLLANQPGDASGLLASHILQAGHHGSKYSTSVDFLEAVQPQAAIVQVGKNNFGHPSPEVIELFSQYGIMVGRNDTDGAVLVRVKRNGAAEISSTLGDYIWLITQ